jgi:inner membrane protein
MPENTHYIWFAIAFIFLIAEISLPSFFCAALALAAFICAFLILFIKQISLLNLILIFSGLSLLIFFSLRKWYLNFMVNKKSEVKFGFESLIGKKGLITKSVLKKEFGYLKIDGDQWRAYSDEEIIKEGQQAEIIKVEGNTVKIKSV